MVGENALVFSVLGSGSGGNCVAVRGGGATVLVDAGLGLRETTARLTAAGFDPGALDAILLTHEHGDHVAHASTLCRRFRASLHVNDATRLAAGRFFRGGETFERFETGRPFRVGRLEILAVGKPHDAADPVAFLISLPGAVLGVFTDVGHVDDRTGEAMASCTALVMESNHDPEMLARGPYPPAVKARVGGRLGHLSNDDGARSVRQWAAGSLKALVLAHVSTTNNTVALVKDASRRHLGAAPGFPRWVSRQDRPTPVIAAGGTAGAPSGTALSG